MNKLKNILFYYNIFFIFCLLSIGLWTRNIFTQPQLLVVVIPLVIYFYGYLLINSSNKIKQSLTNQWFWVFVFLLLLFNLAASSLVAGMNLFLVRSWSQLIISLLFIPFPWYFFLTVSNWYQKLKADRPSPVPSSPIPTNSDSAVDNNRRQFLKLVGGTSLSLIFLSLFNPKKAGAAFFGSVPGPGTVALKDVTGAKINPAEKQPTDGYKISQIDDTSYPYYYGYVNASGAWYIMSEDSSSNFRYTKGSSNFSTSWTARASLTYDYFDSVF